MDVALDIGGWGSGPAAVQDMGGNMIRWPKQESSESILTDALNRGQKAILLWSPYNGGGVKALSSGEPQACVNWIVSKGYGAGQIKYVEWLNEPAGQWFWDSGNNQANSNSQSNADAYAGQLNALRSALNAAGLSAIGILASWDGGQAGSGAWGPKWKNSTVHSNSINSVTYITIHPYVGTTWSAGPSTHDNLGIQTILNAISASGKNCLPTECGIPTGSKPSSDSPNVSQATQATVYVNFCNWAHTNNLPGFVIYNYRNSSDAATDAQQYGVETQAGAKKTSYGALKAIWPGLAASGGGGGGGTGGTPPPTVLQLTLRVNPADHTEVLAEGLDPATHRLQFAWTQKGADWVPGDLTLYSSVVASGGTTAVFAGGTVVHATTPDPTYPYANVSAYDAAGNQLGVWWDAVVGQARVLTTPTQPAAPSAPTVTLGSFTSVGLASAVAHATPTLGNQTGLGNATGRFKYGASPTTLTQQTASQPVTNGTPFTAVIPAPAPGTRVYVQAVVTDPGGTGDSGVPDTGKSFVSATASSATISAVRTVDIGPDSATFSVSATPGTSGPAHLQMQYGLTEALGQFAPGAPVVIATPSTVIIRVSPLESARHYFARVQIGDATDALWTG